MYSYSANYPNSYPYHQPHNDNIYYQWFIVQCDQNPQKCIRKVVRFDELIWNEQLQFAVCEDGERREKVLVRDQGMLQLGYILYKSRTLEDCMERHKFLEIFLMQTLNSVRENKVDPVGCNFNFWVMVMYNRCPETNSQSIIGVYHKREVFFKADNETNDLIAFVREEEATYKGLVIKLNNDLDKMQYLLSYIKKELLMQYLKNIFVDTDTRNQETTDDLDRMLQAAAIESKRINVLHQSMLRKKQGAVMRLAYAYHLLQKKR